MQRNRSILKRYGEWDTKLKNNRLLKKEYAGIIWNIYKKIIIAVIGAIAVVFILRNLFRGYIGNLITHFICWYLKTDDWEYASFIYFTGVRSYYPLIILMAGGVFFAIILRIVLNGFTKYFDEILAGIDSLSEENEKSIVMSKEIGFVAQKLQSVKNELYLRKKEKEDAEKRKDELIVYLAHDIKTPLTSVIGYISLLNEKPDLEKDERIKYTKTALDKATRLEKLINEFFEITRSHAQTMLLEKSTVDLTYMLEQVVDETYPILTQNGKKVELNIEESLQVEMDPQRMARVFTNLVKNACHYSEGEIIKIYKKEKKNIVQIIFENDGYIPQEHLEHLFDKFYRYDSARQTKTGGAGLGLAISKEIISAHQGTIEAACDNGKFRIIVSLPHYVEGNGERLPE